MKNFYYIKCNKYRKFKNAKVSYIFDKILFFFLIYGNCGSNGEKKKN